MLNVAVRAARAAGAIINRAALDVESVRVSQKQANDFVTEVDHVDRAAVVLEERRGDPVLEAPLDRVVHHDLLRQRHPRRQADHAGRAVDREVQIIDRSGDRLQVRDVQPAAARPGERGGLGQAPEVAGVVVRRVADGRHDVALGEASRTLLQRAAECIQRERTTRCKQAKRSNESQPQWPRLYHECLTAETQARRKGLMRLHLCAVGRPHLADPAWTLHEAAKLQSQAVTWPLPYLSGRDQLYRETARAQDMARAALAAAVQNARLAAA